MTGTHTIIAEYRVARKRMATRTIPAEYQVVWRLEIIAMEEVTKAVEIAEDIISLVIGAVIIKV